MKSPILEILHSMPSLDCSFKTLGGRDKETWPDWFTSEDIYPFYEKISGILKPKSYLEIGTLVGYSLISILHGYSGISKMFWVDNESAIADSNRICLGNLSYYLNKFYDPPRQVIVEYTEATYQLFRFLDSGEFDLVHIDGDHTFLGCLGDLLLTYYLRPKWIIVDDYENPEVKNAVNHWAMAKRLSFIKVTTYRGEVVIFDLCKEVDLVSPLKVLGIKILGEGDKDD